ncbi:two-component system alkaline phosphatase synthesis response regulator PhoP [Ulvibacter sp. MAR_2010_11]|uniref:response regulator n=1 Tax=Ulvibacter sp. MAR_2010_11 TaxID=1250229 RepID=UPI000C2BA298|nr:response regulator [Ulvibacter sp. MAR_2010_11]PKA82433.1 two-component system alkaline phosphatase synthesis response regulator PhoP [Ulvibacter sp. MAR_2010_11]
MTNQTTQILIIEDSENILSLLELMLDLQGWKISGRDNVDNIIEALTTNKPDLILMDMLLSGANGCDACKLIKMTPATRHIPVIMMSAHPSGQLDCIGAGADFFIPKPFEMNDLIEAIVSNLNKSES